MEFREAGQRFVATAWEAARTATDADDATGLGEFLEAIEQVVARLEGLRLDAIDRARLMTESARVLDAVTSSPVNTVGRLRGQIRLATLLAERLPIIGQALQDGLISLPQAEAIADGLRQLPGNLGASERTRCQLEILKHADALGPAELRVLATRLTELVDPEGAEAAEARRLAAEERRARRRRRLRLTPDHHGAMLIVGSLPLADGAMIAAQLESLMPPLASYQTAGEHPDRPARTADALVLLAQIAANSGDLPHQGLDRPHVIITMRHETLTTGLGGVSLPARLGRLGAGDARRLACDAGIVPVVLGSASQPLDVGREERLFTRAIRAALTLRDQGCAFPGCAANPAACEAHHIRPWWEGGDTALANAVLLCPFHHRLVEPDPRLAAVVQWRVHLDEVTGLPWFTPPSHIDPHRRPRLHRRHQLERIQLDRNKLDPIPVRGRGRPHGGRPHSGPPLPGEPGYVNPWHPDETCAVP